MMKQCSDLLIAKIDDNMSPYLKTYSRIGVILGSAELYICVIACIGLFVSRQAAFYYMVSFSMAVFLRFLLRMSFRSERPFMIGHGIEPQYCLMSYGTPDSSVMELITMVVVILKNPKSSVYRRSRSD